MSKATTAAPVEVGRRGSSDWTKLGVGRRARIGRAVRAERLFLGWVGVGLVVRLILARSAGGGIQADEASGMLMAARAAHGQFFALFWGANYGGTLVTWLEAPFLRLFGLDVTVFRVFDIALTLVAVVLLRLIAGRLISRRAAVAAAVLLWVFPPGWVYWSNHEFIWWVPGLCVALGVVVCCLRWHERPEDRRLWPIGLLVGVSFWLYPLLGVLVAPGVLAVMWLLRRRPVGLVKLGLLIPVGAAPWIYATLAHHFATLHYPPTTATSFPDRTVHAVTEALPATFLELTGVRLSASTLTVTGLVIAGWAVVWIGYQLRRRHVLLAMVGVPVLTWPFLLAASKVLVAPTTFRYGFVVLPALCIMAAAAADRIRLSAVLPLAAAATTVIGTAQVTNDFAAAPAWDPGLAHVATYLTAHQRTHVYAGYWISYVLSVASGERITATPTGTTRDAQYARLAAAAPNTTFVVYAGLSLDQQITAFSRSHLPGRRVTVGGYAIWEFPTNMRDMVYLAGDF